MKTNIDFRAGVTVGLLLGLAAQAVHRSMTPHREASTDRVVAVLLQSVIAIASGMDNDASVARSHIARGFPSPVRSRLPAFTESEVEQIPGVRSESCARLGLHASREVGCGAPVPRNKKALERPARPARRVCGVAMPCGPVEDEQ